MDIEEDIKIVKEFNEKNRFRDCGRLNNAIDNILEKIEENKKYTIHLTDEQYRKVIENAQKDVEDKYKKQIEELKKYNKTISDRVVEYKKNRIPKQKVKDKIEELKNNLKFISCDEECNKCFSEEGKTLYRGSNFTFCYAYYQIKILQELLEDK